MVGLRVDKFVKIDYDQILGLYALGHKLQTNSPWLELHRFIWSA